MKANTTKEPKKEPVLPVEVRDIWQETALARMTKEKGKHHPKRKQPLTWENNIANTKRYTSMPWNSKAMHRPRLKALALALSKLTTLSKELCSSMRKKLESCCIQEQ